LEGRGSRRFFPFTVSNRAKFLIPDILLDCDDFPEERRVFFFIPYNPTFMAFKRFIPALFCLFLWGVPAANAQLCHCTNCPVSITDNGVFSGFLDVTVNGPNDLGACPLVQVCFTIQHTWIGDLSVSLMSPGGQNYLIMADNNNIGPPCGNDNDNIEICVTPGTANPLTNNTDYICNTGPCSVGNCCLTGNWTVPCGGVTDPHTMGVQAPGCDLNAFNSGGNPANGTWTLIIADNCAMDVGLLLDWSLVFACGVQSCFTCSADGGVLNAPNAQGCFGDPNLFLSLPPSYPGATPPNPAEYGYTYVISQNGTIVGTDPGPNMSTQPPGTYQVCGFSYALTDAPFVPTLIGMNLQTAQMQFAGSAAPFCGDFSDDCIEVVVGPPPPPTIIDTMLCIGDCIMVGGQSVCSSTTLTVPSWLGCDSLITVIIIPIPPSTTSLEFTVCEGDCVLVGNDFFCPPGPHNLFLTGYQGCDSIVVITFNEISASAVVIPDPPDPITCAQGSVTLDGSNSDPLDNIEWTGPNGVIGTDPVITVTDPGDYTLTVINNSTDPPCEDMYTVTVEDNSLPPDLEVLDAPQICAGESFDLATLNIVDNNGTNPTITFHSSSPGVPSNELPTTVVMPATTTTYYILGTNGDCSDETSVEVTVIDQPTADFTVISPICETDFTTVEFTGTASLAATYNWDFDGGNANPGTGPGPHDVTWTTPGTYTISLTVDNEGCVSEMVTQTVEVDAPLDPPVVSCDIITNNSVSFVWDPVAGATGYNVLVLSGQTGTQTGTSFEVGGLAPGEMVEIEVIAFGDSACGESSATQTCTASGCEDILIEIAPVAQVCLDTNTVAFNLSVTVTNSDGTGTGTWSGPGILDADAGLFDPATAGPGTHTVSYVFDENDCEYADSTEIVIVETPVAFFTATDVICVVDSSVVTFAGSASPNATYTWNFGGGNAVPGTGAGPHSVNWATAGPKTVSLIVEENGCVSDVFALDIFVHEFLPEPVLNCNPTLNSIEFFWQNIPNAAGYNVEVLTGQTGMLTSDSTFLIENMTPGEVATIEVTIFGNNNCPNTIAEITCEAQDCPAVMLTIEPVSDICLNGNNPPDTLLAAQSGGAGNGTFTWSGPGIVNDSLGVFDPLLANVGTNNILVTYDENGCTYNASTTIKVVDELTADFVLDDSVCVGQPSIVNYTGNAGASAIFMWDFDGGMPDTVSGAGPHPITWDMPGTYSISLSVEENGCVSTTQTEVVSVSEPVSAPVISCNADISFIEFSWLSIPSAQSYNVVVLNGPAGTPTSDTSYLFDGLNPNDEVTIQVEVVSDGICPNQISEYTCTAQNCPDRTVVIDSVPDICLDMNTLPFDLTASVDGGNGTGTFLWSGDGIVDPIAGTFDPHQANVGANVVSVLYEEGACNYQATLTLNVAVRPTADFSVVSPICLSDFTTLEYTGPALTGATYNWAFDGGTPNGGGKGPFAVSWDTPGIKNVMLTVEQAGCLSDPMSMEIVVDAPLEMPQIQCVSTTSTVEFIWQTIPASLGELVLVLTGQAGNYSSDTSYLFTGLMPDETVTISLEIIGQSACGSVFAEATCLAQNCPDIVLDIPTPPLVCLDADALPFALTATVSGSDGTGTGVWSGAAISDTIAGVFDPALAVPGQNQVIYTFIESGCTFSAAANVEVVVPPKDSFTADSPICVADTAEIIFTGTAQPGTLFTWDFGGGTATPGGNTSGPHAVTWDTPGTKTLTLLAEDISGCVSELFMLDVVVEDTLPAAVVQCNSSTEMIEFYWPQIDGVDAFSVQVLSGQSGMFTSDTSFVVGNLSPNEMVTIEVVSESPGACGFTATQAVCAAIECPTYNIEIVPTDDLCLAPGGVPVLSLSATGLGTDGTVEWSGPGIISADMGVFDPALAGPGDHEITLTYTENNCFYIATTLIHISATPTAEFAADAVICVNESAVVTYTGTGTGAATFNWDFGGGTAVPGTGPGPHQIIWPDGGTKTISLTVSENGCVSEPFTQEVTVEMPLEAPVFNCETTTSSIEFSWNDVPGATGYFVTVLDGPTGTQTTPTSYLVTGLNPFESVTIEVEVLGGNACPNPVASISCEAFACPDAVLDLLPVAPICLDDQAMPVTLSATVSGVAGTGTGTWSGPGISDPVKGAFDPAMAGVGAHVLTFTYVEGNCAWEETLTVEVTDSPMPEIAISDISCFGTNDGAISVTQVTGGTPPYVFAFNGGDWQTDPFWTGLPPGNYEIRVQDLNGCENTLNISLFDPPALQVELVVFVDDNTIVLGDSLSLLAQVSVSPDEIDHVTWEPAELVDCDTCLEISAKPIETTHFTVTVESGGCVDSDDLTVFVKKDRPVYIPNSFSPNGDGLNDVFMIYAGKQVAKVNRFLIFNRWGETVFEFYDFQPNDPAFGWDGTHRGEVVNAAVFVWFAEVEFVDGEVVLFEGDVTLVR